MKKRVNMIFSAMVLLAVFGSIHWMMKQSNAFAANSDESGLSSYILAKSQNSFFIGNNDRSEFILCSVIRDGKLRTFEGNEEELMQELQKQIKKMSNRIDIVVYQYDVPVLTDLLDSIKKQFPIKWTGKILKLDGKETEYFIITLK